MSNTGKERSANQEQLKANVPGTATPSGNAYSHSESVQVAKALQMMRQMNYVIIGVVAVPTWLAVFGLVAVTVTSICIIIFILIFSFLNYYSTVADGIYKSQKSFADEKGFNFSEAEEIGAQNMILDIARRCYVGYGETASVIIQLTSSELFKDFNELYIFTERIIKYLIIRKDGKNWKQVAECLIATLRDGGLDIQTHQTLRYSLSAHDILFMLARGVEVNENKFASKLSTKPMAAAEMIRIINENASDIDMYFNKMYRFTAGLTQHKDRLGVTLERNFGAPFERILSWLTKVLNKPVAAIIRALEAFPSIVKRTRDIAKRLRASTKSKVIKISNILISVKNLVFVIFL